MTTQKSWWAPVWRGLVVDPEGKHCRQMRNAVWLFLHLIIHADRRTGRLKRKCKTIAKEMGVPQKTIQRWLKTLKDGDYIETKNTGRCLEIGIKLWKSLPQSSNLINQNPRDWRRRPDERGESGGYRNWQKLLI
jgi:hypothetical protein